MIQPTSTIRCRAWKGRFQGQSCEIRNFTGYSADPETAFQVFAHMAKKYPTTQIFAKTDNGAVHSIPIGDFDLETWEIEISDDPAILT